jgi:hypothetical protein
MITIKIQCLCGQKYAFDAEPADTLPDQSVRCPVCGVDDTAAARNQMAESLPSTTPWTAGLGASKFSRNAVPPLPPPVPRSIPQRSQKTGRRSTRKWLVPGIVSGVVLFGVIAAMVRASQGEKRAVVYPTAHTDDGFPHTPAEVQAWYAEPESGLNGATFYQKGIGALQLQQGTLGQLPIFGDEEIPPPTASVPEPMRSRIGALLRSNRVALQYFKQGSKFEECRYAIDLSAGIHTIYRHVASLKLSSVLMELAALFHADARNSQQAADDLEVGLALADSLRTEPDMAAQVIRTLGVTRSIIALEQCLNRTYLPSESLTNLAKTLQRMEGSESRGEWFNRAFAAERANGLAALADTDQLVGALDVPGSTSSKASREQLARRLEQKSTLEPEIQFFRQAVRNILAARQADFPERVRSDIVARDELAHAKAKKLAVLEAILPPFTGRATQEGECVAELRLGATAVALERYRRAHGNDYPDALSALVPEYLPAAPVDPFQGHILAYQKRGQGYILRSAEAKAGLGRHSQIRPRGLLIEVVTPPISSL